MIKHTVRSKDGGTEEVWETPLKAIKGNCKECVGWVWSEVLHCKDMLCRLYPYRLGTNPERRKTSGSFAKKG